MIRAAARTAATVAALVLAAPALAQVAPPEGTDWKALLLETLEKNDCVMTEAEAAKILPPLGFEEEWTAMIAHELMEDGLVEFRDGDTALVVKTEKCK